MTEDRAAVVARLLVVLTWIPLTASSLFCAPCFDLSQGFLDGLGTAGPWFTPMDQRNSANWVVTLRNA